MNTKKFRTKTEFIERNNGKIPGVWEIGMDVGYSSVKTFSPNSTSSFPSYAKRVDADFHYAGKAPKESILYRNLETDEIWVVGEVAQNIMTTGDTSDSEMSLYGRERYGNPMFPVLVRTGLGLSMMSNQFGAPEKGERIVVQTGLPANYMSDEPDLIDAIEGRHRFALLVGTGSEWKFFDFEIKREDVFVMSQPKGTLFSVCIAKNGQFTPEAPKYLSSSILVFDPGFGTLDLFPVVSGVVKKGETNQILGMKRVLQETVKSIKENFGVDVLVPEMQKYLATGKIPYVNRKKMESREYEFDKLLAEASDRICNEAIDWMSSAVNLIDFNYMIITGGTGAAWEHKIRERLKGFTTLTLVNGNQNDDLSFIYSNARGYYLYRYNKLGRENASS